MTRDRYHGRVVLVTGAARGIGRAIARAFADEGAVVAAADISASGLEALEAELADRVGLFPVDLADLEQTVALVGRVLEQRGRLDVLVNCAGVQTEGPALDVTP
ncbi:MAG TPA: SDR family NAD(P)-dependent oxidoreductase, partial [Actinomycetota bacterium]|nr:SDR family NAD(P)-dependent oxidoreductase [Actinomycetota bacterium]